MPENGIPEFKGLETPTLQEKNEGETKALDAVQRFTEMTTFLRSISQQALREREIEGRYQEAERASFRRLLGNAHPLFAESAHRQAWQDLAYEGLNKVADKKSVAGVAQLAVEGVLVGGSVKIIKDAAGDMKAKDTVDGKAAIAPDIDRSSALPWKKIAAARQDAAVVLKLIA